ncbi:hypothetical protein JCM6882_008532 [Rhodosporidiobolus microsporus]
MFPLPRPRLPSLPSLLTPARLFLLLTTLSTAALVLLHLESLVGTTRARHTLQRVQDAPGRGVRGVQGTFATASPSPLAASSTPLDAPGPSVTTTTVEMAGSDAVGQRMRATASTSSGTAASSSSAPSASTSAVRRPVPFGPTKGLTLTLLRAPSPPSTSPPAPLGANAESFPFPWPDDEEEVADGGGGFDELDDDAFDVPGAVQGGGEEEEEEEEEGDLFEDEDWDEEEVGRERRRDGGSRRGRRERRLFPPFGGVGEGGDEDAAAPHLFLIRSPPAVKIRPRGVQKRHVDAWGDIDGALSPSSEDGGEGDGGGDEELFEVEGVEDVEGRGLVVSRRCAGVIARPLLYLTRLRLTTLALVLLEVYLLALTLWGVRVASVPHLVAAVGVGRGAAVGWALFAPLSLSSHHTLFHQLVNAPSSACAASGALIAGFWGKEIRLHVAIAVVEAVVWVAGMGGGWLLAKTLRWETFRLVGADRAKLRSHNRSLAMRAVLLSTGVWVVGYQSIWLHTLRTYPWPPSLPSSTAFLFTRTYFALLVALTVLVPFVLLLGWLGEKRRCVWCLAGFEAVVGIVTGHAGWLLSRVVFVETLSAFSFLTFLSAMAVVVLSKALFVGGWSLWEFVQERKAGKKGIASFTVEWIDEPAHAEPKSPSSTGLVEVVVTPSSRSSTRRRSLSFAPSVRSAPSTLLTASTSSSTSSGTFSGFTLSPPTSSLASPHLSLSAFPLVPSAPAPAPPTRRPTLLERRRAPEAKTPLPTLAVQTSFPPGVEKGKGRSWERLREVVVVQEYEGEAGDGQKEERDFVAARPAAPVFGRPPSFSTSTSTLYRTHSRALSLTLSHLSFSAIRPSDPSIPLLSSSSSHALPFGLPLPLPLAGPLPPPPQPYAHPHPHPVVLQSRCSDTTATSTAASSGGERGSVLASASGTSANTSDGRGKGRGWRFIGGRKSAGGRRGGRETLESVDEGVGEGQGESAFRHARV